MFRAAAVRNPIFKFVFFLFSVALCFVSVKKFYRLLFGRKWDRAQLNFAIIMSERASAHSVATMVRWWRCRAVIWQPKATSITLSLYNSTVGGSGGDVKIYHRNPSNRVSSGASEKKNEKSFVVCNMKWNNMKNENSAPNRRPNNGNITVSHLCRLCANTRHRVAHIQWNGTCGWHICSPFN